MLIYFVSLMTIIFIIIFIIYYHFNVKENFDAIGRVYYCQDCKGKTFGQCQDCLSCVWVIDQDKRTGKCIKGDPYRFKYTDVNRPIYAYQRDPFFNSPYYAMTY